MQKGKLTKEQAIEMVGAEAVEDVGREHCEPTGRVGYNGGFQGDSLCEWAASVKCTDKDGDEVTLTAYYYTTNKQDEVIYETGDGWSIDWKIEGYEVV